MRLTGTLNHIYSIQSDFPLATLLMFLHVAKQGEDGCNISEAAKALNLSYSAAVRASRHLSTDHWDTRGDKEGLGWIKIRVDAVDARVRLLTLTPKGKAVIATLAQLNGEK